MPSPQTIAKFLGLTEQVSKEIGEVNLRAIVAQKAGWRGFVEPMKAIVPTAILKTPPPLQISYTRMPSTSASTLGMKIRVSDLLLREHPAVYSAVIRHEEVEAFVRHLAFNKILGPFSPAYQRWVGWGQTHLGDVIQKAREHEFGLTGRMRKPLSPEAREMIYRDPIARTFRTSIGPELHQFFIDIPSHPVAVISEVMEFLRWAKRDPSSVSFYRDFLVSLAEDLGKKSGFYFPQRKRALVRIGQMMRNEMEVFGKLPSNLPLNEIMALGRSGGMSDLTARQIEHMFGLPPGWLRNVPWFAGMLKTPWTPWTAATLMGAKNPILTAIKDVALSIRGRVLFEPIQNVPVKLVDIPLSEARSAITAYIPKALGETLPGFQRLVIEHEKAESFTHRYLYSRIAKKFPEEVGKILPYSIFEAGSEQLSRFHIEAVSRFFKIGGFEKGKYSVSEVEAILAHIREGVEKKIELKDMWELIQIRGVAQSGEGKLLVHAVVPEILRFSHIISMEREAVKFLEFAKYEPEIISQYYQGLQLLSLLSPLELSGRKFHLKAVANEFSTLGRTGGMSDLTASTVEDMFGLSRNTLWNIPSSAGAIPDSRSWRTYSSPISEQATMSISESPVFANPVKMNVASLTGMIPGREGEMILSMANYAKGHTRSGYSRWV